MANKVRGEIAAEFNGAPIKLALTTNAICELEDRADRSINDVLAEIGDPKRARMKTIRLLFWALMLEAKPDATERDAGALIDGMAGDHDRIMTAAIVAAFPDAEDEPGK